MQAIANFIFELRGNGIPSNMILTPQVFNRRSRTVTRVSKTLYRFSGEATDLWAVQLNYAGASISHLACTGTQASEPYDHDLSREHFFGFSTKEHGFIISHSQPLATDDNRSVLDDGIRANVSHEAGPIDHGLRGGAQHKNHVGRVLPSSGGLVECAKKPMAMFVPPENKA
ncbi:hypothetical protein KIN20_023878 [Parelaphostrongylus tenuis]|uniref:Uncharacterized protein n=1 Tax=Parelaphostrongylus tenuis TaxID=148309 RepID=A0AAD5MSF5_PARTN|nr:hypothetical protein KIN20_023878 [Parelaphostrongylus tenuis]